MVIEFGPLVVGMDSKKINGEKAIRNMFI